jgi:hypothetical protein
VTSALTRALLASTKAALRRVGVSIAGKSSRRE